MIHAILIAFENPEQTLTRFDRDVFPALTRTADEFGGPAHWTIIDNSRQRSDSLNARFGTDYRWMGGNNLQYGPAINEAVRNARRPSAFTVYACTRHGRAFDPGWAADLIRPMVADPLVGLTGCLWGSNSPEGVAHSCNVPWIAERFRFTNPDGVGYVPQHVQGGVFAARTEVLLRFPYPNEIAHLYTDHYITWAAMKAGYTCYDVPSVRSVWRDRYRFPLDGVKYLHDENHV